MNKYEEIRHEYLKIKGRADMGIKISRYDAIKALKLKRELNDLEDKAIMANISILKDIENAFDTEDIRDILESIDE